MSTMNFTNDYKKNNIDIYIWSSFFEDRPSFTWLILTFTRTNSVNIAVFCSVKSQLVKLFSKKPSPTSLYQTFRSQRTSITFLNRIFLLRFVLFAILLCTF